MEGAYCRVGVRTVGIRGHGSKGHVSSSGTQNIRDGWTGCPFSHFGASQNTGTPPAVPGPTPYPLILRRRRKCIPTAKSSQRSNSVVVTFPCKTSDQWAAAARQFSPHHNPRQPLPPQIREGLQHFLITIPNPFQPSPALNGRPLVSSFTSPVQLCTNYPPPLYKLRQSPKLIRSLRPL